MTMVGGRLTVVLKLKFVIKYIIKISEEQERDTEEKENEIERKRRSREV